MKKSMRAAGAGALALVAMFSVSGCFGGAHGTPAVNAPQSLPGAGTDSGMQFNVTGITTASTLGNGFMVSTAKGVYVVVSMTVKNVSSNATGSIDRLNSNVLIDSTGRQYPSDYSAATNMSDSSTDTLQPGSWGPLNEAFDVPVGTTPTAIVMIWRHGNAGGKDLAERPQPVITDLGASARSGSPSPTWPRHAHAGRRRRQPQRRLREPRALYRGHVGGAQSQRAAMDSGVGALHPQNRGGVRCLSNDRPALPAP